MGLVETAFSPDFPCSLRCLETGTLRSCSTFVARGPGATLRRPHQVRSGVTSRLTKVGSLRILLRWTSSQVRLKRFDRSVASRPGPPIIPMVPLIGARSLQAGAMTIGLLEFLHDNDADASVLSSLGPGFATKPGSRETPCKRSQTDVRPAVSVRPLEVLGAESLRILAGDISYADCTKYDQPNSSAWRPLDQLKQPADRHLTGRDRAAGRVWIQFPGPTRRFGLDQSCVLFACGFSSCPVSVPVRSLLCYDVFTGLIMVCMYCTMYVCM